MPYAITVNGWRAINEGMELQEGEAYTEEIPQSFLDSVAVANARAGKVRSEEAWREQEISAINNQLMALEEAQATGEDTGTLPGTQLQWLKYRTKVREWKDDVENFPEPDHRPARPE
jgi:hypothetical protein